MAINRTNAIGGELGLSGPAAEDISVDTSDFDTAGSGTNLQEVLVELEARIAAVE